MINCTCQFYSEERVASDTYWDRSGYYSPSYPGPVLYSWDRHRKDQTRFGNGNGYRRHRSHYIRPNRTSPTRYSRLKEYEEYTCILCMKRDIPLLIVITYVYKD